MKSDLCPSIFCILANNLICVFFLDKPAAVDSGLNLVPMEPFQYYLKRFDLYLCYSWVFKYILDSKKKKNYVTSLDIALGNVFHSLCRGHAAGCFGAYGGAKSLLVEALSYAHPGARCSLLGPSVASAQRERQVVSR